MSARFCGVLTCGHIWTCPTCSARLRAERAERINAAVSNAGGTWIMLTVTLRHRAGMPLSKLLAGLILAWRKTRQGGLIQRLWSERVSASARAVEITYGDNGWHPHLHVLLRVDREWSAVEKEALLERWQDKVAAVLGSECAPSDRRALVWSAPFDASDAQSRASYLAKLGLEVAGLGKDSSVWSIARRAAAGCKASLYRWQEFYDATRGRRMLELDDRAQAFAMGDERFNSRGEMGQELATGVLDLPETHPVIVPLHPEQVSLLRWGEDRDPALLRNMLLAVAAAPDAAAEVSRWLALCEQCKLAAVGPERDAFASRRAAAAALREAQAREWTVRHMLERSLVPASEVDAYVSRVA